MEYIGNIMAVIGILIRDHLLHAHHGARGYVSRVSLLCIQLQWRIHFHGMVWYGMVWYGMGTCLIRCLAPRGGYPLPSPPYIGWALENIRCRFTR